MVCGTLVHVYPVFARSKALGVYASMDHCCVYTKAVRSIEMFSSSALGHTPFVLRYACHMPVMWLGHGQLFSATFMNAARCVTPGYLYVCTLRSLCAPGSSSGLSRPTTTCCSASTGPCHRPWLWTKVRWGTLSSRLHMGSRVLYVEASVLCGNPLCDVDAIGGSDLHCSACPG